MPGDMVRHASQQDFPGDALALGSHENQGAALGLGLLDNFIPRTSLGEVDAHILRSQALQPALQTLQTKLVKILQFLGVMAEMRRRFGPVLDMQHGYRALCGADHGFEIGKSNLRRVGKIGGVEDMGKKIREFPSSFHGRQGTGDEEQRATGDMQQFGGHVSQRISRQGNGFEQPPALCPDDDNRGILFFGKVVEGMGRNP